MVMLVGIGGWTGLSLAQERRPEPPKPKDIVDVAKDADNLKTFCKLLKAAGLVDTLKDKGPHTVFAPTDEAFQKLGKELDELQKPENKAKLEKFLKHHVLEGNRAAADLKTAKTAKTLAGDEVTFTVKEDVLRVDKSAVVKADTAASNGTIHVIDAVLLTPDKPAPKPEPKPEPMPEPKPEPKPEPTPQGN